MDDETIANMSREELIQAILEERAARLKIKEALLKSQRRVQELEATLVQLRRFHALLLEAERRAMARTTCAAAYRASCTVHHIW